MLASNMDVAQCRGMASVLSAFDRENSYVIATESRELYNGVEPECCVVAYNTVADLTNWHVMT